MDVFTKPLVSSRFHWLVSKLHMYPSPLSLRGDIEAYQYDKESNTTANQINSNSNIAIDKNYSR